MPCWPPTASRCRPATPDRGALALAVARAQVRAAKLELARETGCPEIDPPLMPTPVRAAVPAEGAPEADPEQRLSALLEPIGNVPPAEAGAAFYAALEATPLAAWVPSQSASEKPGAVRFATTDEVANMIVYACSEQASATSGAALRVDGGVERFLA